MASQSKLTGDQPPSASAASAHAKKKLKTGVALAAASAGGSDKDVSDATQASAAPDWFAEFLKFQEKGVSCLLCVNQTMFTCGHPSRFQLRQQGNRKRRRRLRRRMRTWEARRLR